MKDFNLENFVLAFESLDPIQMGQFFDSCAWWKFGNESPLRGVGEISDFIVILGGLVESLRVKCEKSIRNEGDIFFSGAIGLKRNDQKAFDVPVSMRIKLEKELIVELQTYCDLNEFMSAKDVPI